MEEQVNSFLYNDYKKHILMILNLFLGVGKSMIINVASQWAEVILLKVGDDPTKPRVMLMAFTGMAASLIGKSIPLHKLKYYICFLIL